MKWKIKLRQIGRQKVDKDFEFEGSLSEAEYKALLECEKYLISSNVNIEPSLKSGKYLIYAGFHKVGEVYIDEVLK